MTEIETIFQKLNVSDTWFCQDTIKLPNRASSYGDGLFETMVWDGRNIRHFDKHLRRLLGGMQLLGLDVSMINSLELTSFLESTFLKERKRIRWTVFRAGGGKYTPEESAVIQVLQIASPTIASSIKKNADVSKDVRLFPSLWSKFKTLNSLPYILANKEKNERELDELILLDHRGFISEASIANIFWMKDGVYFTPSISCGCIDGISRQVILDYFKLKNIPFEIGEFELDHLSNSEQVFVSNSSGVSYLERFREERFSTEPIPFLQNIFY